MREKHPINLLENKDRDRISLGLTGDVMLGRLLDKVISLKGYDYPWGNVLPLLQQNDINLINLETTLTHCHQKLSKVFNFRAKPDKVNCLQRANIHIANLANNHILDFTEKGLQETITTLQAANIKTVGAGIDLIQASQAVYHQVGNLTFGVIGCTDNEPTWKALNHQAGVNYLKIGDISPIAKTIQEARAKANILIVSIHWGPNNREIPSKTFVDFAHTLIDHGVDIIHGHSAHVVQGIEIYKKKLILYDTGDFVDDYAVGPLRNDHTFLFQVLVNERGLQSINLTPLLIADFQVNLAKNRDYTNMVARIQRLSKAFGTELLEKDGKLIGVISG